ncbi:hypothetical protein VTN96DRAFT_5171 [Rasamsonia emersonii]
MLFSIAQPYRVRRRERSVSQAGLARCPPFPSLGPPDAFLGLLTPRLELCCLESAPPPDTRAPRYSRGPAIAPSSSAHGPRCPG